MQCSVVTTQTLHTAVPCIINSLPMASILSVSTTPVVNFLLYFIPRKISALFRELQKVHSCSTTAPSYLKFLEKLDKTFVLGQYNYITIGTPDLASESEIAAATESATAWYVNRYC